MKASSERITSLCTSLGRQTAEGYIPADDCEINLDELAFSIWRDDEAQRNVSTQAYQLGVFKRDLIPILLLDGKLSYNALKALTAITYPPSSNVEELEKQMNILVDYKIECSFHPEIIAKVLEYCSPIIDNPRAESTVLNNAELALTFIRNIAVIPCQPDVHERIFNIFNDFLLFDVIDMLKIIRFGDRSEKFARIIAGIFYGCFVPYLPLRRFEKTGSSSILSSFLEDQKAQQVRSSSRHGHWGGSVTIKGKGKGYTVPLSVALNNKSPLPAGKHLTTRSRPVEKVQATPNFSKIAEQAAAKMISSQVFPLVFELAFPRTFSAYEKSYSVREQLHLVDMTKFFYDFTLKYGPEIKVNPLAHSKILDYFQSMFMFWMEAPTLSIEGVNSLQAMHSLCKLLSSLCAFLIYVIQSDNSKLTDKQVACQAVSKHAAEIENFLVTLLCQKNLTKKPISMLKDNIIALEQLYKVYQVAEQNKLVRYKLSRRDEDADPDDPDGDRIEENISAFNSDQIVGKLARRIGVLKPFFIVLSNYDSLDDEIVEAMTKMLKRFSMKPMGLAHLFSLPYFYVIFKLWEDKKLERSKSEYFKELDLVLQDIIRKFFFSALNDKTMFIQLITGLDQNDLYDAEMARRRKESQINSQLGLSQEVVDILNEPSQNVDGELVNVEQQFRIIIPDSFDDVPLPSKQQVLPKQPSNINTPTLTEKMPTNTSENRTSNDRIVESDSDSEENMSLEDLRKAFLAKNNKNASENATNITNNNKVGSTESDIDDDENVDKISIGDSMNNEGSQNTKPNTINKVGKVEESDDDDDLEDDE
ncbi:hypothetical protein TRFO_21372 [Tritrichomonas foetus]|uniref:Timeless N-terminal domain-containing protein n=1 Tax=Tritrichomonas foetus TaxID=1144522 RepID=A0A1J4KIZ5_9EUKA|nr:hypothetical protein TRFO_21372 [Tritrichomonas foetus]|eukprot:OHT09654.1 hypothetical protein TRFO_21372 [Tritrichomonas foetus]